MSKVFGKLKQTLYLKDTPTRLARGAALGFFVAWTPTIGIQMAVSGVLALVFRANAIIAVAMAWISNPYTAVPIYWFNYWLGCLIVGGKPHGWEWFKDFIRPAQQGMTFSQHMAYAYDKIWEIAFPLFLGSVVSGLPLAIITYIYVLRFVKRRDAMAHPDNVG